jgi:hypothetical protein
MQCHRRPLFQTTRPSIPNSPGLSPTDRQAGLSPTGTIFPEKAGIGGRIGELLRPMDVQSYSAADNSLMSLFRI